MDQHLMSGRDSFCETCWATAKAKHAGVGAAAKATYERLYRDNHDRNSPADLYWSNPSGSGGTQA